MISRHSGGCCAMEKNCNTTYSYPPATNVFPASGGHAFVHHLFSPCVSALRDDLWLSKSHLPVKFFMPFRNLWVVADSLATSEGHVLTTVSQVRAHHIRYNVCRTSKHLNLHIFRLNSETFTEYYGRTLFCKKWSKNIYTCILTIKNYPASLSHSTMNVTMAGVQIQASLLWHNSRNYSFYFTARPAQTY